MRVLLMTVLGAGIACGAMAVDAVAYHGQLTKADGSAFENPLPLTVSFAFYAEASGGTPLWGRTLPVKVERDGTFFVELSDGAGSAMTGCASTRLVEALQGVSQVWVGLTPAGSTEMKPRMPVLPQPRALVARTAGRVDAVKAGEFKADRVVLGKGTLGNVSAARIAATQSVAMSPSGDVTLEAGSSLKLTHTVSGYRTETDAVTGDRTARNCGSILWYQPSGTRGDQWGSIVYPRGATLHKEGSAGRSQYFGKEL